MSEKLYIGFDLSTVASGYSVFSSNEKLMESGVIVPSASDVTTRIREIATKTKAVISNVRCKTDKIEVIIEDVYYGSNYLTTKILNRLAGAVIMTAMDLIPASSIIFVTPTGARKSMGILPKSTKAQVVKEVNKKFGLDLKLKDNDEADGIVLGFYGVWKDKNPEMSFTEQSKKFFKSGMRTPRMRKNNEKKS